MRCTLALYDGVHPSFLLLPTAHNMNVRQCLGLCLACLLSGLVVPASADDSNSFRINISKERNLNFGSMVVTSSDSVTISPETGSLRSSANVVWPASLQNNTDIGPARFVLTCVKNHYGRGDGDEGELEYRLRLENKPDDVRLTGGGSASMALSQFEMHSSLEKGSRNLSDDRKIDARKCSSYREIISVGATLQVGNSPSPGRYTNDIRLEVSYEYDD